MSESTHTQTGRNERIAFLTATGLVALHVADDAFLQPEPGVSAADHLAGGLVQLGLLLAAAWVYPRCHAGARAVIALIVGTFGIVIGVEGAHALARTSPTGDDFTGLLAIPAGLVLVGTGVLTLWRSRKLSGTRRRRWLRRALIAIGALASVYVLVLPLALAHVVTHVARAPVAAADLGAPYEEVSFTTSDGLVLRGWYVPSRNGAAVIAFPGRKGPQPHARMLVHHGYGVLLFDRRGEGASEGDPNALGWNGYRDLDAAVAFLRARPDVSDGRIGGLGLSVGGEMLIEAAAHSDGLRAVVSEGAGIRSVREAWAIPETAARIQQSVTFAVVTLGVAVFTSTLPPPSLVELVGRVSPAPLFLLYAVPGQGGEDELSETYFAAAGEPKELWQVPDAEHTGGLDVQPAEYERRVIAFFDDALLGERVR